MKKKKEISELDRRLVLNLEDLCNYIVIYLPELLRSILGSNPIV